MVCSELKDVNLSAIIARKLATVHHLNVPINKDPTWLFETYAKWLSQVRNFKHESPENVSQLELELLAFDFESEMKFLSKSLPLCESPIVFCHNDLQEGNILLPSEEKISSSTKLLSAKALQLMESHIVFIDFEFCSYNFRGFDIGNHFCERMFDYSNPEWPHYYAYMDQYPDDQAKRSFIREYLKQSMEIKADDAVDTEDHLVMEADFCTLASHFLWILWSINNARNSKIAFGYLVGNCFVHKQPWVMSVLFSRNMANLGWKLTLTISST